MEMLRYLRSPEALQVALTLTWQDGPGPEGEGPTCRICLEGDVETLVSPCACRGAGKKRRVGGCWWFQF